jgi:hypothetical protein
VYDTFVKDTNQAQIAVDSCKQKLQQATSKGTLDDAKLAPLRLQLAKAEANLAETTKVQRKKLVILKQEKRALIRAVLLAYNVC